jgi:hypothetical protein
MFQLGSKKGAFKASMASVTLTATDAPLGACRTGVTRPINGPIVCANRGWVTGNSEVIGSSFELVPASALVVIDGPTPGLSATRKLEQAAIFQRVRWDRGPQLPSCVVRRMCAIAHSTRERMSISETRVRWTGHFSAISSSFERCSWVSRPANSRSLSMWSSIPSSVSQSEQSAA